MTVWITYIDKNIRHYICWIFFLRHMYFVVTWRAYSNCSIVIALAQEINDNKSLNIFKKYPLLCYILWGSCLSLTWNFHLWKDIVKTFHQTIKKRHIITNKKRFTYNIRRILKHDLHWHLYFLPIVSTKFINCIDLSPAPNCFYMF